MTKKDKLIIFDRAIAYKIRADHNAVGGSSSRKYQALRALIEELGISYEYTEHLVEFALSSHKEVA